MHQEFKIIEKSQIISRSMYLSMSTSIVYPNLLLHLKSHLGFIGSSLGYVTAALIVLFPSSVTQVMIKIVLIIVFHINILI